MLDTSARLLALLSLLQSRPAWSGSELAERLGVSGRTIRNDIDRLRELGYPVDATRGATGHYRLGAGANLPPLLLDDEEAVAVAIGLRAGTGVQGIQDSSARALAKLEQVLPHRLRRKVAALHSTVSRGPDNTGSNVEDPEIDAAVLTALADAIRDTEWVRFAYREEARLVEPYRLVSWQRRWYLVARDQPSGDWATFRVDWMDLRMPTRRAFEPAADARGGLHLVRAARRRVHRLERARPHHRLRSGGGGALPHQRGRRRRRIDRRPHLRARHRRRQLRDDRRLHRDAGARFRGDGAGRAGRPPRRCWRDATRARRPSARAPRGSPRRTRRRPLPSCRTPSSSAPGRRHDPSRRSGSARGCGRRRRSAARRTRRSPASAG